MGINMTHRLDFEIGYSSDDAILKRLMDNPARIPMLDMICVVSLREKGFVICGQEMDNCIAIHAHDGDRIIEGVLTTFAWVVITPKGRAHLYSQGYMVPDEFGTVKVPRASEQIEADLPEWRKEGQRLHEGLMASFRETDRQMEKLAVEIMNNLPFEYKSPSPDLIQTLSDMEHAQILAAGVNGEDLDD